MGYDSMNIVYWFKQFLLFGLHVPLTLGRCDGLGRISDQGCRSTYAHVCATDVTSGGRSNLTPCQNVETEFITHEATVLHNNNNFSAL